MDNLNKISKFFLLLLTVSCIFWLGGYVARHLVVYQFFEPENLDLKSIYNETNLTVVINTIAPLIVYNLITYILFIVSFLIFIVLAKINYKKEGWFLIATVAVIITAPFEFYLSYIDFKIINSIYIIGNASVINEIKERITSLSSFSFIEIFTYIGINWLFIYKPLRKNEN